MMGSYNSALIPDAEEFDSIVWSSLNEQRAPAADETLQSELRSLVTFMIEKERRENQSETMNSSANEESTQETSQNCSPLQAADKNMSKESFSSLLPKALSAVLNPAVPPTLNSDPRPRSPEKNIKPNVEQLQAELKDLRDQFEQMKSQHNKEIKLLMNELDEEKRIRLTLQMEIQRMKKHMSK
ncbi:SH3 domain-containing kinase-binding protein 1 isoform X1 [Poecilia latipinna]|uniref:SH3 domain-containing kinase-binding protein 1 isoform X1 n=1 Tax=Poecilia formosa TaxID=48698 RepID=UPI00044411B1|nr:PREDICTED: SH3 domain-containing kinase-binding protein 1-like isoform X1 [Poecilia formosa]XP_014895884.1 PREDICTED: SH3 domain-containing kinase-binding protein 1-like isoform X1 [Poecilia latipinna]